MLNSANKRYKKHFKYNFVITGAEVMFRMLSGRKPTYAEKRELLILLVKRP